MLLISETLYKISIGMGKPKLIHTFLDGWSYTSINECIC